MNGQLVSTPLTLVRQYDGAPFLDMVFATLSDMDAYIGSARRYGGMQVTCLEDQRAYLLSTDRTVWIPVGPNNLAKGLGSKTFTIALDGTAGKGAIGAITLPEEIGIPLGAFIWAASIDVSDGLTADDGTAFITAGIEVDDTTALMDGTEGLGLVTDLNLNIVTKILEPKSTKASDNRTLVMAVGGSAITAGTIEIIIILTNQLVEAGGGGGGTTIDLQTNSISNAEQDKLNLVSSSNIIPQYVGSGAVNFSYAPNGYIGNVVSWSGDGLTFDVSSGSVPIDGVLIPTPFGTITLDDADADNPRIDVIGRDNTGAIIKVTGTPNANPEQPQVDPTTQFYLTSVNVAAGALTPTGFNQDIVYDENVENWTLPVTSGTITINPNNTVEHFHGAKSMDVQGNWTGGKGIIFTSPVSILPNTYSVFKFAIKLKTTLPYLAIMFMKDGVYVTPHIYGFNYGFVSTSTDWQNITIPISAFGITSADFNKVIFISTGGTFGFYLDYIQFQSDTINPVTKTPTLQQAFDASVVIGDDPQIQSTSTGLGGHIDFQHTDSSNGDISTLEISSGTVQLQAQSEDGTMVSTIGADSNGAVELDSSINRFVIKQVAYAFPTDQGTNEQVLGIDSIDGDKAILYWKDVSGGGGTSRFGVEDNTDTTAREFDSTGSFTETYTAESVGLEMDKSPTQFDLIVYDSNNSGELRMSNIQTLLQAALNTGSPKNAGIILGQDGEGGEDSGLFNTNISAYDFIKLTKDSSHLYDKTTSDLTGMDILVVANETDGDNTEGKVYRYVGALSGYNPLIEITKGVANTMVIEGTLVPGQFYAITGVNSILYNDGVTSTTIILQAITTNSFAKEGEGIFYNPNYGTNPIWTNRSVWGTQVSTPDNTINTLDAPEGGSGYTDGSYSSIATTSTGGGQLATLDITVSGGVVTFASIDMKGRSYTVGDILTVDDSLIGGGTGFSIEVTSVNPAAIFIPNESVTANNGATGTLYGLIDSGFFIPATGDWTLAETITGDTSGATAEIFQRLVIGTPVAVTTVPTGSVVTFTDVDTSTVLATLVITSTTRTELLAELDAALNGTTISYTTSGGVNLVANYGGTPGNLYEFRHIRVDGLYDTDPTTLTLRAAITKVVLHSYGINDKVIWGGYSWTNINGNMGATPLTSLALDSDEWTLDTYDSDGGTNYTKVIDVVGFDFDLDSIVRRYSVEYNNDIKGSTINKFPFGNSTVFNNYIDSASTVDMINWEADPVSGNVFRNSSISNVLMITGSIFTNSTLVNTNLAPSSQCYITNGHINKLVGEGGFVLDDLNLTGILAEYGKTLYSRPDATVKLRYYNDNDIMVISDILT